MESQPGTAEYFKNGADVGVGGRLGADDGAPFEICSHFSSSYLFYHFLFLIITSRLSSTRSPMLFTLPCSSPSSPVERRGGLTAHYLMFSSCFYVQTLANRTSCSKHGASHPIPHVSSFYVQPFANRTSWLLRGAILFTFTLHITSCAPVMNLSDFVSSCSLRTIMSFAFTSLSSRLGLATCFMLLILYRPHYKGSS